MRYEGKGSRRRGHPDIATDRLARGLGAFSIALGLVEVCAPRAVARAVGLDGREALIRAYGWREIATGIGLLAAKDPTPWAWGRVAGDLLDLATLAPRVDDPGERRGAAAAAMGAVAGVAALDVWCAKTLSGEERTSRPRFDYRDRTGFPRSPEAMRGLARGVVAAAGKGLDGRELRA